MANVFAPFGFKWAGRLDGSDPNAGLQTRQILNSNTNAIFWGDPVVNASGYVAAALSAATIVDGIFYGCSWLSASQNRIIHSPFWPQNNGDAVAGTVSCLVCSDPLATFIVQGGNATTDINRQYSIADINHLVSITNAGNAGNTATGFSTVTVTGAADTTATRPFKITGLLNIPVGNGGDPTTPYNFVLVTFNNEVYKSTTTAL